MSLLIVMLLFLLASFGAFFYVRTLLASRFMRWLRMTFVPRTGAHATMALALIIMAPKMALATTTGAVTVDLSPLVQALVSIAVLVITGAVPTLLIWLNKHLGLSQDSLMAQRVSSAVNAAAQLAIAEIGSIGAHNLNPSIKSAAVANAITKLSPGAQAAITALGLTPEVIAQRVDGEITKALGVSVPPAAPAATPSATA